MRSIFAAIIVLPFLAVFATAADKESDGPKTAAIPAVLPIPSDATGRCKDGTYTMSKKHSKACSGHGGVSKWL
jgi:hypothetical protein